MTTRLVAVGDVLGHGAVHHNAKTVAGYDYTPIFRHIAPFFESADVCFYNQEGPVAGERLGISGYPEFNAPEALARDLHKLGCNLVGVANNHIADRGRDGIVATLDTWENLGPLAISGASRSADDQQAVHYFTVKGTKFAFIAFTEFSNLDIDRSLVNFADPTLMTTLATEARQQADIVIASMHWGYDDSPTVHRLQVRAARLLSHHGVDIILGTGPHVLQRAEWLQRPDGGRTLVWYSLGNFLSGQLDIQQLIGGLAIMELQRSASGMCITKVGFLPTYTHYEWSAADREAGNLLARRRLALYPLDRADGPISRSLHTTTVAALQRHVALALGPDVTILNSQTYLEF